MFLDEDIVIAITIPFMVMFIVSTVAVVFIRMLKHREIIQYAKRGMYPPYQMVGSMVPTESFKKGITATSVGLGITFGLSLIGIGVWLIAGLIPLFIGMGMLLTGWMEMRAGVLEPPEDWASEPTPLEKSPDDIDFDIKL